MKIHISKSADAQLGTMRINQHVFERLEEIAKEKGVSKQEVVRAILDQVIDDIEV
jgi:predicted DNA-binding protein